MIKPKNKICISCGSDKYPWFSKKRCRSCAQKEYTKKSIEKNKDKPNARISPRSDKGIDTRNKDEAYYAFIWKTNPHFCHECSVFLGHTLKYEFISHIYSKGAAPEHRHKEVNALVLCFDCHQTYEFGEKTKMRIWDYCEMIILRLKQGFFDL